MPAFDRTKLRLIVSVLFSLLAHAAILLPLLVAVMSRSPRELDLSARFHPHDFNPPDAPPPPETPLGMDAGTPATLTWIGYDAYVEHMARLSEVEQAAFTREPGAPGRPAAPRAAPPPPDPKPGEAPAAASSADAAPVPFLLPLARWQRELAARTEDVPEPAERVPDHAETPPAETPAPPAEPPAEPGGAPTPTPSPPVPPAPGEGEDVDDPAAPAAPNPKPRAKKESDATSTMKYRDLKPGQPLSAKGLEIEMVAPTVTTVMRATASLCNPVVYLRFERDGVPRDNGLRRTSCDARWDRAFVNSLYSYRATGAPLEALGGDEFIEVEIEVLMR